MRVELLPAHRPIGQLAMKKAPCDEVTKVKYHRYRSIIFTLNSPLTLQLATLVLRCALIHE